RDSVGICSFLHERSRCDKYLIRCIVVTEATRVGHQSRVQAVGDAAIDFIFSAELDDKSVYKFCRRGCGGIPLLEIGKSLRFQVMVDKYSLCRRPPNHFAEFVDARKA